VTSFIHRTRKSHVNFQTESSCAGRSMHARTHVVFMLPRNPSVRGPLLTARDMTSDDLFSELLQAVHGTSNWYFSSVGETTPAGCSFATLNEPAVKNFVNLAQVRCISHHSLQACLTLPLCFCWYLLVSATGPWQCARRCMVLLFTIFTSAFPFRPLSLIHQSTLLLLHSCLLSQMCGYLMSHGFSR
jgi:hypothetical protein